MADMLEAIMGSMISIYVGLPRVIGLTAPRSQGCRLPIYPLNHIADALVGSLPVPPRHGFYPMGWTPLPALSSVGST